MKIFNILSLFVCLIPAWASNLNGWTFIFDIPNTLIEVDSGSFLKDEIGTSVIWYTLTLNNPAKLKTKTFAWLHELDTPEFQTGYPARDPDGEVLPQVYCDFLLGKENSVKRAKNQVNTHDKGNERDIIENITKAIFSPEKLAKHAKVIKDGHKLLQECKNIYGADALFMMSNLNGAYLEELFKQKHTNPVMRYFSGSRIFISQTMKALLPDPACFEVLIRNASDKKIDLNHCIFISAMEWNVHAARKAGIKALWIEDKNFKKARKELQALGIL